MAWIQFLTLPVLGMIAWEDLRERSIHWWWLPVLALAALLFPVLLQGLAVDGPRASGSTCAILWFCNWAPPFLYLIIRHGAWMNPVDRFIGLGDVLFFLVLALGLSRSELHPLPTSLDWPFACSGLLPVDPPAPHTPRTVPTAGFLAVYLAFWCVLDLLGVFPDLTTGSVAEHLLAHAG